jgi:hypothetical protein
MTPSTKHTVALGITLVFVLLLFAAMGLAGTDPGTCPDFGQVPVVVEGEDICIPWEDVEQLVNLP